MLGGTANITATTNALGNAGIMILTRFLFHLPIWLVQKTNGSLRKTARDDCKLDVVRTADAADRVVNKSRAS